SVQQASCANSLCRFAALGSMMTAGISYSVRVRAFMTMNNWNEFLNRQMVDKTPSDFVQSVIPDLATYLVALKHHGLLTVEGPDAAKFLQGQVTCDLRELD